MDADISSPIERSFFRVRLNGSCLLLVSQGSLEQIIICALKAGNDISILSMDNDLYKLKI